MLANNLAHADRTCGNTATALSEAVAAFVHHLLKIYRRAMVLIIVCGEDEIVQATRCLTLDRRVGTLNDLAKEKSCKPLVV